MANLGEHWGGCGKPPQVFPKASPNLFHKKSPRLPNLLNLLKIPPGIPQRLPWGSSKVLRRSLRLAKAAPRPPPESPSAHQGSSRPPQASPKIPETRQGCLKAPQRSSPVLTKAPPGPLKLPEGSRRLRPQAPKGSPRLPEAGFPETIQRLPEGSLRLPKAP